MAKKKISSLKSCHGSWRIPLCCRHFCLITQLSFTALDETSESPSPAGKMEREGVPHRLLRRAPTQCNRVRPVCKILLVWKRVDSFSLFSQLQCVQLIILTAGDPLICRRSPQGPSQALTGIGSHTAAQSALFMIWFTMRESLRKFSWTRLRSTAGSFVNRFNSKRQKPKDKEQLNGRSHPCDYGFLKPFASRDPLQWRKKLPSLPHNMKISSLNPWGGLLLQNLSQISLQNPTLWSPDPSLRTADLNRINYISFAQFWAFVVALVENVSIKNDKVRMQKMWMEINLNYVTHCLQM